MAGVILVKQLQARSQAINNHDIDLNKPWLLGPRMLRINSLWFGDAIGCIESAWWHETSHELMLTYMGGQHDHDV